MSSNPKQWQAFLGLQYQVFACKPSATLHFVGRCAYSTMLIVATAFAILRPGETDAQDVKAPMARTFLKTGQSHGKESGRFRFSPDGKLVATWWMTPGGHSFGVGTPRYPVEFKLWDVNTAEERFEIREGFAGFTFSPDSKTLLIWGGKSVLVRDISTGNHLATLQHDESEVISYDDGVQGAQYVRNGELLITGATDRFFLLDIAPQTKIKFWNTSTWEEAKTGFDASQSLYWPPAVTPDGKTLAAIVMGSDETRLLKIWDIDTGREEPAPDVSVYPGYPGLCLRPDIQTLAIPSATRTTGRSNGINYWDLPTKKLKTVRDYLHPSSSYRVQQYSRYALFPPSHSNGGDNAVSVELTDSKFIIRNWQTEQVIQKFINPTSWQTTYARGNGFPFRIGRRLDQAGSHLTGNQLLMLHSANPGGAFNFGQIEIPITATSLLEIVDITTGKLVAELSNVMCETVSPDGEYLVTQHLKGGGLVLWKTRGGIELTRFPSAEHAQFSPDGTVLGTGEAGDLKLWNVADFLKAE